MRLSKIFTSERAISLSFSMDHFHFYGGNSLSYVGNFQWLIVKNGN